MALANCALPASAPTASQIENPTTGPSFTLVKVDQRIVGILAHHRFQSLGAKFKGARYVASNVLKSGDSVAITIYETGGSLLFGTPVQVPNASGQTAPTPAGVTTIPPQVIESDGTITMPFVGRVTVARSTPGQAGQKIAELLQGKAIEPQVIVTLINNNSNTATVSGEVAQPRPVLLSLRGERLLDVIAAAGGAKYPPYETYVRVVRGGTTASLLLQTIINTPSENVIVRPNDQIILVRNPRTFVVLGASQKVSQYTFDTEKVTLAEALARAGGPIDQIGDPTGIYLFRYEPWEIANEIWQSPPPEIYENGVAPEFVPVLYRLGFGDANGYFLAQAVLIRDKDVVLMSNSEATQMQKALGIVRGFTGIAYDLTKNVNN